MRKTGKAKTLLTMLLAAAALQAGTAFGAQATGESQLQAGTWVKEAEGWKFRKPSGEMATGWIQTASGWYYLQPENGLMETGMLRMNDRTYYFNANPDETEGKMTTGWYQDAKGSWYFFNTTTDSTEGAAVTGWQWVDGRSYYFEPAAGENHGKMFADGVTPDGYKVNAAGQWVDDSGKVQVEEGKGFASAPSRNTKGSETSLRGGNGGGGGSSRSGSGSSNAGSNVSDSNGAGDNNNSNNINNSNNDNNTNNSNNTNNNSNSSADQTKSVFVKEDETGLVEVNSLGWWITVAFEDGYNAGNTKVYADDVDVTSALSNVTDDGSICKLAVIKPPAELTVSNAADPARTQIVSLDDEAANGVIYTGTSYLPEKILSHGPVALWDYYLTNYADDGSVRYSPSKTTFALGKKAAAHPAYSPDAELSEDGKATVTIMFNYNTDEEKEWFDGINRLQLVEYNENKNTINSNLVFDRAKNVPHGKGRVGELTIETGQSNFTNNGRYYVRIESKSGTSALVPIHVVNAQAPVFKLKETPQSGVNLHFQVENMVYGIETPVNRVVLEGPTETVELDKINDWFLFSQDLFVIYNDNVDHFKYKGNYKLTVYADGFKSASVEFTVTKGESVPSKDEMGIVQYSFDGISTASVGSGSSSGSGESDSGSMAVSANLVFDTDLLVNANILEEIGKSTTESEAVIDWWYEMAGVDAAFNKNDKDDQYYDWVAYIHSVERSKTTGIIPFEDYKTKGVVWNNSPAAAKEVLEDGLLGEIQNKGDFSRPAAGAFTIIRNRENEDVFLSHEDKAYLAAIRNIVINGSWTGLTKEQYSVDVENGILTLNKSLFTPGEEYKITVEADGYQMNAFKVTYDQILEEGLSLSVKYEDNKKSYVSEKRTLGKDPGFYADATVEVTGSEGGFLKYLQSVALDDDTLYTKGVESSDASYYAVSDDKKTLTIGNIKPGEHTLTVRAKGYADALRTTIVVDEGVEDPAAFEPEILSFEYTKAEIMAQAYYTVTFNKGTTDDEKVALETYLANIEDIKVGDTTYTKVSSFWNSKNNFRVTNDPVYGGEKDRLCLTENSAFEGSDELGITINAGGYKPLTFNVVKSGNNYVLKDGTDVNPPAADKDAPQLTGQLNIKEKTKWTLTGNADYLKAITSVTYGEEKLSTTVNDTEITIDTSGLSVGTHTLTINADSYNSQVIEVQIEAEDDSDNTGDTESSSDVTFESVSVESWLGDYEAYRLLFKVDRINNISRDTYLGTIDYIMVGTFKYEKCIYGSISDKQFKVGTTPESESTGNGKDYIDFAKDSFDSYQSGDLIKVTIYSKNSEYSTYVFYIRDGKLVDQTEAEEELLDEQESTEDGFNEKIKDNAATGSNGVTSEVTPSGDEENKADETGSSEENKDETKDETKDESKDETKDDSKDETKDDSKDESREDSPKEPETPSETENSDNKTEDSKEDDSEDNSSEDSREDTSETAASDNASEDPEVTKTEGEI